MTGEQSRSSFSLWKKIGIIGSIASIISLLLYFSPILNNGTSQLTVFVTDERGAVVLEHQGILNTSIGHRALRENIGEDGRVNFGDIHSKYIGDSLVFEITSTDWELVSPFEKYEFTGDPINLKVTRGKWLGIVKGVVTSYDGIYLDSAKIVINSDTAIYSDHDGLFRILLPVDMRVKNSVSRYSLTISHDNYKSVSYLYSPNSHIDVRLPKP